MKTSPNILIIGKNGQLGWELQRTLMPLGKIMAVDRNTLDLADNESIRQAVHDLQPDVIVNAAAYTAVDQAEQEIDLAMQINGIAPGVLAEQAKQLGALLIHYSTDYVFDGTKPTPYIETDKTNPINIYGESKLAGEQAVQAVACNYLIFRTSWVFASRGNNFLLTMLKLMKERESLRVINDQSGTPTWARLIAAISAQIVRQSLTDWQRNIFTPGLYHLTSAGETSWYGFAKKIKEIAEQQNIDGILKIKNIIPINSEEYPTSAQRPINSRMAITKLEQKFNLTLPDWRMALELCMKEIS